MDIFDIEAIVETEEFCQDRQLTPEEKAEVIYNGANYSQKFIIHTQCPKYDRISVQVCLYPGEKPTELKRDEDYLQVDLADNLLVLIMLKRQSAIALVYSECGVNRWVEQKF
jgi:hypothetical protein